ncbi:ABC transporter substrate-binding protein [Acuticoccus sp. I52.16.1]|uniref:ABC transporter substrate-binding protein n=1 Tax=Acuticoccus sp. I52.16.1 TaxID=2928472 RepID=UPI001FD127EF|nr:ABC transporter substrate-binding protein [Acuticoccus sp. I52.16.1]UOM36380.1 ABC transporter substrate-binding protein [Acuticoccus sp. I52.16.1]
MPFRVISSSAGLLAALAVLAGPAAAEEASCDIDRPVVFGGLDYGSAAFHTALARTVLEKGYGCETEVVPGTTLVLNTGMGRGDVDVLMEVWTANTAQAFLDAEAAGDVERLGATFPDASEGWFVPRYVVEGEGAPAPDLVSVSDLKDHADLFPDDEEPGKGRFLNCVIGWQCEVVNSKKLAAYGLDELYSNVRPGAGAALEAAVEAAVLREKPVLFYHWAPTWLLGKYDFVKLEEPAFDQATWDEMMASEDPAAATAYPLTKVVIGANTEFTAQAPALREFFMNYGTTAEATSQALAYMRDTDASPEQTAQKFLAEHPDVWQAWVPETVATQLNEAISK